MKKVINYGMLIKNTFSGTPLCIKADKKEIKTTH